MNELQKYHRKLNLKNKRYKNLVSHSDMSKEQTIRLVI